MIARDWCGETAFIFAGGPSLLEQPFERLKGRRVIVINSSVFRAPWADILYFHDPRWWQEYGKAVLQAFSGRIYTTMAARHPRLERLRNTRPGQQLPGRPAKPLRLSDDPGAVPMRRTSTAPALNIAVLKGATRIVLLGCDGKFALDGTRNHYETQYKWPHAPNTWDLHREDLAALVAPIADCGVEVINASPGSAYDLWPVMTLEEALANDSIDSAAEIPSAAVAANPFGTLLARPGPVGDRRQSPPKGGLA